MGPSERNLEDRPTGLIEFTSGIYIQYPAHGLYHRHPQLQLRPIH
jgi:hypothetical protein